MTLALVIVVCAITVTAINCESDIKNNEVIRYLQLYGYLENNNNTQLLSLNNESVKHAISLFQEYYRLPGNGILNNVTLHKMRKPRCGLADIPYQSSNDISKKWPRTHLTWNFHLAETNEILKTTEAAFALWAANSSLTFERKALNPDILISFRNGFHTYADDRFSGTPCEYKLDGPGGVLAHAYYPSGSPDFVSEVHVDHTEPWHIFLNENPPNTMHLLQTLTHEIGHSLGLPHSPRNDSVMYAFATKSFPIKLSIEDILAIQNLYGVNDELPKPTSTPTTTTEVTTNKPEYTDLCDLQYVDTVLILDHRIFIAHKHHVWSIGINDRVYDRPLSLGDYMGFLPANFKHLSAAYQRPSGDIVLFANNQVYMVTYPSFELIPGWPRTFADIRIPQNAKINAAINTNKGRTFVIYNNQNVAEIDECTMRAVRYSTLQAIFPGIPTSITSAFRYIDGNLYFFSKRQFYKFNEFTRTVTMAGRFDLQIVGIECPREGLIRQLQNLLNRIIRSSNIFKNDLTAEEEEENEIYN